MCIVSDMTFERFISQRYLRVKQKEVFVSLITFLSMAGVAVGVMALIVVIAVMSGAETDIRNRILGIQSHIVLMNYGGPISDVDRIVETTRRTENVVAATPLVYSQAMIRSAGGIFSVILRGIDPESAGDVTEMLKNVSVLLSQSPVPKVISTENIPGIVLGKSLAKNLTVGRGDIVYLITPRGMASAQDYIPARKRFKVLGVFSSGMHEYDTSMAYISLETAQKVLRMEKGANVLAIRLHDIYRAQDTAEDLNAQLGFPYWARDWMQMNRNLFSALKLQKTVMGIILTLIVLVAAFNTASALIMMVMEKTREIAILKTMGATSKSIKKIFIYKGMVIGVVGTLLGVSFGWVLCTILKYYHFIELPEDVYYFTTLPVRLELLDVVAIASATLLLCFISTLYPARQAAKLDPVDAIRYG